MVCKEYYFSSITILSEKYKFNLIISDYFKENADNIPLLVYTINIYLIIQLYNLKNLSFKKEFCI